MAFSVPTFNLVCDVYSGPWSGKVLRIHHLPCNLAFGRRVQQSFLDDWFQVPTSGLSLQMGLLVPALTDLRDPFQSFAPDVIECPAGSQRWYGLLAYDDVAKGFSNEYRFAIIVKIGQVIDATQYSGLFWPTPAP
jgi:hypothetical protein